MLTIKLAKVLEVVSGKENWNKLLKKKADEYKDWVTGKHIYIYMLNIYIYLT